MRNVDLIIFDCDGVLLDSERISCECATDALQSVGMDIDVDTVLARYVGLSRHDMAKQAAAEGYPIGPDFTEKLERTVADAFEHRLQAIAGVDQVLSQLSQPRCIASGSPIFYIRRGLELAGLQRHFGTNIFSASMVARGKPAPDIFLYAAAQMGVMPDRCLVIEDSLAGVQAANAAGMQVFSFLGGSHIDREKRPMNFDLASPDLIFDSMLELPRLIANFARKSP